MSRITLSIARAGSTAVDACAAPNGGTAETGASFFANFEVDFEEGSTKTLLDALEEIRSGRAACAACAASAARASHGFSAVQSAEAATSAATAGAPGLRYRHSCHHGSCGTCGALVDGRERLMCLTPLDGLGPGPVRLEPLRKMTTIGDLAVHPGPLFAAFPEGVSYLCSTEVAHRAPRDDAADSASPAADHMTASDAAAAHSPDPTGAHEPASDAAASDAAAVNDSLGHRRFEACIECGLCVSACPVSAQRAFAGPAALAAADRDREERPARRAASLAFAASPEGVAGCNRKFACSKVCPQGVAPGRRIESLRKSLREAGIEPA